VLRESPDAGPARTIELAHQRLRGSRGAAIAVGRVVVASGQVRYAAIGNIATRVLDGHGSRSLVSLNGIVGVQMPNPKEFECVWPAGGLLVAHSDGLTSRWDLASDARLLARHPAVVAGVLYRDHIRGPDDATVLVGRLLAPARGEPRGAQ
jgi:hypothetical protein